MAKKAKKVKTAKGAELRIVNPDAAGIDIADGIMQVCVPADRSKDNNRTFGAYTSDLHAISAWLVRMRHKDSRNGIHRGLLDTAVLSSSEDGLDVVLTNARDVKNITERKTDESDAEWLMLLHQYGLLKASFQPHNDAKRMRTLTRHRDTLSREASSIVLRMQKAMQQMNIKLTLVLSDITGKSGIRIIEAILAGERDPKRLAELADIQCKTPKEEITKALEGNWEEDLMFVLEAKL
ncbi:transposase [Bacteroides uniformis]|nr:transposase [Bacteroides uniformis]